MSGKTEYRGTMTAFLNAARAFLDRGVAPSLLDIGESIGKSPEAMAEIAHVLRRKGVISTERRFTPPRGSRAHVTSIIRSPSLSHSSDSGRKVAAAARRVLVMHEALAVLREYPDGVTASDLRMVLTTRGYTPNAITVAITALGTHPDVAPRGNQRGLFKLISRLPLILGPDRGPTCTPGWNRPAPWTLRTASGRERPGALWVVPALHEIDTGGARLTQYEVAKIVERLKAESAPAPEPTPEPVVVVTETRRAVASSPMGRELGPELARGTAPVRRVEVGAIVDADLVDELRELFACLEVA